MPVNEPSFFQVVIGKITEQANVVTILLTLMFSATVYGWIEGTLYPYYPFKEVFEILHHFTWYHVAFLLLFLIIGFSLSLSRIFSTGLRRYYLLTASTGSVLWGFWIEDMSYFATRYPNEFLAPGVWVESGLGGFYFFGHWMPSMYVLLCGAGFVMFGSAFLLGRRDSLIFRAMPVRPRWNGVRLSLIVAILFMLLEQPFNLLAASITNLALPFASIFRLMFVLLTVLVPSLILLLIMDIVAARYSL